MDRPLNEEEIGRNISNLQLSWNIINNQKLEYEFRFPTFDEALIFVNKIAEVSRNENHYPDICIFYNKVKITTWTHLVDGLSSKDFKIAMIIENIFKPPY